MKKEEFLLLTLKEQMLFLLHLIIPTEGHKISDDNKIIAYCLDFSNCGSKFYWYIKSEGFEIHLSTETEPDDFGWTLGLFALRKLTNKASELTDAAIAQLQRRTPTISYGEVPVTGEMLRGDTLLGISQMLEKAGLTTKRELATSTVIEYATQKGLHFEPDYDRVLDHIHKYPEMFREWFASKYPS